MLKKLASSSSRQLNLFGFLVCVALLSFAYYSQFVMHLEPCPLCIFQRIAVIGVGIVFLIAFLHGPKGWGLRVYGTLLPVFALAGASVSARHTWLQHLPADLVPSCGPGLDYMLDVLPLTDTLRLVFTGSGECAHVSWRFLGLSMPEWMLIVFPLLAIFAIWNNWRRPHSV